MLKYILLILSLPLILVFIWFKDGYLLSHAEGALPFYNLERYLEPTSSAWMEHPGLGNISLFTTIGKPTYIILTFLQNNLGLPGFVIQAVLFYFLLAGAGLSVYLLVKEFFPKLDNKYALLSVLFYWFNPLSLTDVWNRFLLNYIFFFGALPIFLLLFVKGLIHKKYYFAPLLTLIIGIYSYSISTFVFVLLLWFMFILFTIFFFITTKNSNDRWFYIKYLGFLLILFIFTNTWWITQLFSLKFQMPFNQAISNFSTAGNFETLKELSIKLGNLTNVFRLINASSPEIIRLEWINFFNSPLAIFLEFLIVGIILFAILRNIADKYVLILSSILFIIIFLIKGTNAPLGEIYSFFFQTFSPLQVFRNPFEKFSFVLNIIISLLVGYSIFSTSNYVALKTKKLISPISFFFFLIVIVLMSYPFYSGLVFTSTESPTNDPNTGYKVKVPDYYKEASDFMESKGKNFRFIGFPLGDEGITYKWEKGYTGVELPSTLFSTPGILFNTAVPYYADIVPQLEVLFLEDDNFLSIANSLNIRFLLLRTDIDWQERNMKDPTAILDRMNSLEKKGVIKKIGQYGALSLWENLSWKDYTFYAANKIISSSPENINLYNIIPNTASSEASISNKSTLASLDNLTSELIVNPTQIPDTQNLQDVSYSLEMIEEGDYQLQYKNLSGYSTKDLIEKQLISINNSPVTTLEPIHFKKGTYQMIIKDIHGENSIDLTKSFESVDSRGYFKNFEINNFDSKATYTVNLDYQSTTNQKLALFIFQDNDKLKNNEKITHLNLSLDSFRSNNSIQLNSFFDVRPSSTKAWIALLSDQPIDISSIKTFSVEKLVKPKPTLIMNNTNFTHTPLPIISYEKINTTKYIAHITNATTPFMLIFSELFNNKWEAFYSGVSITQHFRANSYANAWLVNKTGNFDITIEFTPERLYERGETISLISHLFNGILLIILIVKNKRKIN